jgi:hypothetical protein
LTADVAKRRIVADLHRSGLRYGLRCRRAARTAARRPGKQGNAKTDDSL